MSTDEITCPDCGHTFTMSEAAWTVCLGCGVIAEPGDTLDGETDNHPKPRGPGTDCFMAVRKYTETAARTRQADIQNELETRDERTDE